ncbi:MAG: TetR/AcrR family transcriptional regulator [Pseudomonadota bacterium]|nr:TetR/AcrR family transcriptional regulator [Pseudomonadota bacterium]
MGIDGEKMQGRRRSFDKSEVLDRLMSVFWEKGYAGTSMSDLTEATGLTKPSLYAAYGNKEAMYCAALDCYLQLQARDVYAKLEPDGRGWFDALDDFLKATAKAAVRSDRPVGCFVSVASCDAKAGVLPKESAASVAQINSQGREALVEFFKRNLKITEPEAPGAASFADYVLVLQAGIVHLAVGGADYPVMKRAIGVAMEGLAAAQKQRL